MGLQKPAADRIWTVAVTSDPSAVDALGRTLRDRGDAKGAKAIWSRLAASDPGYAERAGLLDRLK